jgi:tRNA pseudouridine55 synthase
MTLDDRVLLVDKRPGTTSFAAVRQLRRATGVQKVGHCGSLDPLATGLLILCTGAATRVASLFVNLPKEYHARVRFGRATDSYDADGRTTGEAPVPPLDPETLRQALRRFEGEIDQVPPMVSAVKVQGRRLYELARRGEEIERSPRKVMVYRIELVELGAEHCDLRVRCGKGCYVRSIAHELGVNLEVPAHLEALRRVAVGPFRVEQATSLEALQAALAAAPPQAVPSVRSLAAALSTFLPALRLRRAAEAAVRQGVQPEVGHLSDAPRAAGPHLLLSEDGLRLLAIVEVAGRPEAGRMQLVRVFHTALPVVEAETDGA